MSLSARSISARLYIAFGALIGILLSVGWIGAGRMSVMNRQIQEIVGHRWQDVQLAREALQYSTRNNRLTMQVFLTADRGEIDVLLEERVRNSDAISALLGQIAKQNDSPEEEALVAAIWAKRTPYVESYKRALALLLDENQPDAARQMMTSTVLPKLIDYHRAWEAFVDHQASVMSDEAVRAEAAYRATKRSVLSLLLAAGGITAAITVFVTRSLSREVADREAAEMALTAARGKLVQGHIGDLERVVAERTADLNRSEAQFRALAEKVPDLITLVDASGNRVFVSPSYRNILGILPEEILGTPATLGIHPEDQDEVRTAIRTVLARRIEVSLEYRIQHRDGTWRVVECHFSPAREIDPGGEQLVLVARDITARKKVFTSSAA
jgi:PAS domain S-box-containing protein